ncbi:YtxH domain-containing protein [Chloroflexota bacterium]
MEITNEERSNKYSGTCFTIGLIIGAAAGILMGLIYTPRSGNRTRKLLKEKVRWMIMSPSERYAYLLARGGFLRKRHTQEGSTTETT